jgi:hypothetical protein
MRIDTNYAYGTHRNNYPVRNVQGDNVSFGLSLKLPGRMTKGRLSYFSNRISSFLDREYKDVKALLKGSTEKRAEFLNNLADRYNSKYFYTPQELRESPDKVFEIYKKFRHPHRQHFNIVAHFDGSFAELEKVLEGVKDKDSYEFIKTMQKSVLKGEDSERSILFEALKSPNRKKFVQHFEDYEHYFKLNRKNKNAVAELDKLIESGKYKKLDYEREFVLRDFYEHFPQYIGNPVITKENLAKYYSQSGVDFLDECFGMLKPESYTEKGMQSVLNMYKTTNPDNFRVRKSLFREFLAKYTNYFDSYSGSSLRFQKDAAKTEEGLQILENLFDKMDNNSAVEKLLRKAVYDKTHDLSLADYELILNTIPAKKASVYFENICRVLPQISSKEEKVAFLQKQVSNPFFETAKMAERKKDLKKYSYVKESVFDKAVILLRNIIDRVRYALSFNKKIAQLPQTAPAPVDPKAIVAAEKVLEAVPVPVEVLPVKVEEIIPKLPLSRTFKSNREATRYQVISDVNNVIKSKLGMKTYDNQRAIYEKNATKMRLKLLPEIFDSIKETRAADRMAGRKVKTSNSDAVNLYSMIKGRNRKLVNYMLKKRNVDGTRMFNVKDIIELLNKSEKTIVDMKAKNPDFRAKDAKMYYDAIHADMVNSYGKVKRVTKPKAKSQTVVK